MTRQNCISLNLLMAGNLSSDLTLDLIQITLHSSQIFFLVRKHCFSFFIAAGLVSPMATCLFAGGKRSFTKRVQVVHSFFPMFFLHAFSLGQSCGSRPGRLNFSKTKTPRKLLNRVVWHIAPKSSAFLIHFWADFSRLCGLLWGSELQRCHRVLTVNIVSLFWICV